MARRSTFRRRWIPLSLAAAAAALAALLYLFPDRAALLRTAIAIARVPHASIEVIAFDERGRMMGGADFLHARRPTLIVRDHNGAVCFGFQYGIAGTPRLAIPPAEPVSFDLPWTVPGFGRVLLTADNRGHGYRVSAGAYTRIELLPELAQSRLAEVERWVASHNQGHAATDDVAQGLAFARRQLARMDTVADPKERSLLAVPALRAALQAGEQEVLAEASNSLSERRGGKLLLKVIDRHGYGVPNVKIRVNETRTDFLFAVGTGDRGYDSDTIARLKQIGVNYATLDLNRLEREPRSGVYAFDPFDRRFNPLALKQNGFILSARIPVVSFNAATTSSKPPVGEAPSAPGHKLHAHLAPILKRYKDPVDVWQIDASAAAWPGFDDDPATTAELIKAAAETIRKGDTDGRIMLEVAAPLGQDVTSRHYPGLFGGSPLAGLADADPYTRIEFLSHTGVSYDLVGLRFDPGASMDDAASGVPPPPIDLFRFALELDRYARLGKPLRITGLAAASSGQNGRGQGWWHAAADEGTQADYLAGAFTIAYANPHVQAIEWPALYDADAIAAGRGLLDRSNRPKAAYGRMVSLLAGWRGDGEVTTGPDGTASFQGPAGDYQLSAQVDSTALTGVAHIHQGAANVAIMSAPIEVAPAPPPIPPAANPQPSLQTPEIPEAPEAIAPSEPPSP